MKQYSEYRAEARQALHGNWATAALFYFIYGIIACVLGSAFSLPFGNNLVLSNGGSFIGTILCMPMAWAVAVSFLRLYRGEEQELGWLFNGYPQSKVWTTEILKLVYTFLWSLLLIIPGIVKGYSYSMTEFIMQDNPDMKDNAAIEESMRMMQGRKWDLFVLDLTFLGWIILACLFTLGIGLLWIEPYIQTTHAAFYEEAKKDYYGPVE